MLRKKKWTEDRSNMVGDLIGTARRIKKVDLRYNEL